VKTTAMPNGRYRITGLDADVEDLPDDDYPTEADAESDRRGMKRFQRADKRGDTNFIHGTQDRREQ